MRNPQGPDTVFTSPEIEHPVDRSCLDALEARVGEEFALTICSIGMTQFAMILDEVGHDIDHGIAVLRSDDGRWSEVGRYTFTPDAYRSLGRLLDEVIDRIPIDAIDRPSPTLIIRCRQGLEIMYRTAEGIRIARQLDAPIVPRFEVYDHLWESFTAATEDEASDAEYRG